MLKDTDPCWCGSERPFAECHFTQPPPGSVLIINGHPNSGKSSVRSEIYRRLYEPYFFEYDFDACLSTAFRRRSQTREGFLEARDAAFRGIGKAAARRSTISDILCSTRQLIAIQTHIERSDINMMLVRLYTDTDERIRRDRDRLAKNPLAPHGFHKGVDPNPDPNSYAMEIDTTTRSVPSISDDILEVARETILNRSGT